MPQGGKQPTGPFHLGTPVDPVRAIPRIGTPSTRRSINPCRTIDHPQPSDHRHNCKSCAPVIVPVAGRFLCRKLDAESVTGLTVSTPTPT